MKNLEPNNILTEHGEVSIDVLREIEEVNHIKLPKLYVDFITKHNGAQLVADAFGYYDPNYERKMECGFAFVNVEEIQSDIELLQDIEGQIVEEKYRFPKWLIPFGDNGGGDDICFDYRKDKTSDNPPIVMWFHDMGFDHRIAFIAKNFEEFINMLYAPKDE